MWYREKRENRGESSEVQYLVGKDGTAAVVLGVSSISKTQTHAK